MLCNCARTVAPVGARRSNSLRLAPALPKRQLHVLAAQIKETDAGAKSDAEETALKYGLEAGLFKAFTTKDKSGKSSTEQAKQLLTQYGSAYLLTSISFAIVSFTLCYLAVDSGVDIAALLAKIGLQVNSTNETVGTFAIAYAAHKALSPVRFPPTVALTPVVAKWLGKKGDTDSEQQQQ